MYNKRPALVYHWRLLFLLFLSLVIGLFTSGRVMAKCHGCGRCLYCVEGNCIPNRTTYGYYRTHWRRWPCNPTFGEIDSDGQRLPGIPESEVPDRKDETSIRPDLPGEDSSETGSHESSHNSHRNPSADEPISQVAPIDFQNQEVWGLVRRTDPLKAARLDEQFSQSSEKSLAVPPEEPVTELAEDSAVEQTESSVNRNDQAGLAGTLQSFPSEESEPVEFAEAPLPAAHYTQRRHNPANVYKRRPEQVTSTSPRGTYQGMTPHTGTLHPLRGLSTVPKQSKLATTVASTKSVRRLPAVIPTTAIAPVISKPENPLRR